MGSPQIPHSGGGPLSIVGSSGSSNSSSSDDIYSLLEVCPSYPSLPGGVNKAVDVFAAIREGFFWAESDADARRSIAAVKWHDSDRLLGGLRFHLQLQRLFSTLPRRHPDKGQFAVDNGSRHGSDRMTIRQFLSIGRVDIDFTIVEAVLDPQLFPQALRRGTRATGRRD